MGRLHFLDALRGLAALSVVAFHLIHIAAPPLEKASGFLQQPATFGATGVYLFFVISGFSLEMTMGRHQTARSPLLSYTISRIFRILPLFYVLIILWWIYIHSYGGFVSSKTLALNFGCLFNIFPGKQEGIVAASWTIGVEMLFYAAFPALHHLRTPALIGLCATLTVVFLASASRLAPLGGLYQHWTVLGWGSLFIFGILAFRILSKLHPLSLSPKLNYFVISTGVLGLLASALIFGDGLNLFLRTAIGISYAIVIVGAGLCRPKFLESSGLRFYGRISYSLYLLHVPVLIALRPMFRIVTGLLPDVVSYVMCYLLVVAVLTPVAWLAYVAIEAPFEKLGKGLIRRLARSADPRLQEAV